MRKILLVMLLSLLTQIAKTQITEGDTLRSQALQEVVVSAFEQSRQLVDVAAAINVVNKQHLYRFNNTSILPALNITAGVRMEERSPGSYRLNIRGSSLRSPFGVRNVKVYYNHIPFTDPGGNTYLNQLGFYNFQTLEVIKGPGSSLYGSGTGGVLLANSNVIGRANSATLDHTIGSYGLQNTNINLVAGSDNFKNSINYQHQESSGYRQHSSMRRDVFTWETAAQLTATDKISTTFLYGDLYYQTPGALTLSEYTANPRSARPPVGQVPGSMQAQAAIYQKTFLAGVTYDKAIAPKWTNTSTIYGAFTQLLNPTIRNYGRTSEPHFGGRTIFQYKQNVGQSELVWHNGAELQQGFTTVSIFNNNGGTPAAIQSQNNINSRNFFLFSQLSLRYKKWLFTTGASFNQLKLRFIQLVPSPYTDRSKSFSNEIAPRIAGLYKLTEQLSVYATVAKGFSPPTTAELFPTGSVRNLDLEPEKGWNNEMGVKGTLLRGRLFFDINAFYFRLQNTIVQRRDAAGGDYFTNAGSTNQKGIETQINYQLLKPTPKGASARLWLSHSYYRFRYQQFKQLNNDFSGNKLPGISPHSFNVAIDVVTAPGIYTNLTYQYTDPSPLNDANTAYASSYNLFAARVGVRRNIGKQLLMDLYAGGENLFDVTYSLGNDINGFGGRFYNAAPGRSYFIGVSARYAFIKD